MPNTFTIGFICHNDFELLQRTIPQNLQAICNQTDESYDVVLVVDGAENISPGKFLEAAEGWGIDELRFRWRHRNCATGDPSNNGHFHLFSDKSPYLLTMEGDVAIFKTDPSFDVLKAFKSLFQQHKH